MEKPSTLWVILAEVGLIHKRGSTGARLPTTILGSYAWSSRQRPRRSFDAPEKPANDGLITRRTSRHPGSVMDQGSRIVVSSALVNTFCSTATSRTVLPDLYASLAIAAALS